MERDTREELLKNLRDVDDVLWELAGPARARGAGERLWSLRARLAIYRSRVLAGESSLPLAEDLEAFTEEYTKFVNRFA